MRNKTKDSCILDYVVPTGTTLTSGQLVVIGDYAGVSQGNYAEGETAEIHLEGVFELKKKTGEAWTVGAKLYWEASGSQATTSSASGANPHIGYAEYPYVSGATLGEVRLKQI